MLDRTVQPAIVIPGRVDIPETHFQVVANGIPLYTLRSGEVEVIRLSLVFRAGNIYQSQPFVASSTLGMLNEGTTNFSAAEIAEKFDFYGSIYDISIDRDYVTVTVCALSRYFGETLSLLEEVVLRPAFRAEELKIYADKRKQKLEVERTKVGYRSRELFAAALFGSQHPYGVFSDASHYDRLTPELLGAFHRKFYTARNCFAVSSAAVTEEDTRLIVALLEKIPSGDPVPPILLPDPLLTPDTYIEVGGAVQSAVRVGKRMFPRNHPDFIGMQVVATLLGGYFGSRLVTNLREDKGYTYGAFAGMINLEQSGYLAISTEVAAEVTEAAVSEIFHELTRLREEPVTEAELEIVKNTITGESMRILDGPFGIADVTIENHQNGTDNEYLNRFLREVNAITPEKIRELARRHLTPEDFATVVVGNKKV